jgi:hypothetical protein
MTDYMLTVVGSLGLRDVQVNDARSIKEAIAISERQTGCRVSHGRGGVGVEFDPSIIIDAQSGEVQHLHDRNSLTSGQVATGRGPNAVRVTVPKGA